MGDSAVLKWRVGAVHITRVVELATASLGRYLLPQATPEVIAATPWLGPFLDDQLRLVLSMHSLIVQTPSQTVVVDTCIGNDKARSYPRWNRMQSDFLARFRETGVALEAVDTVLCTHLHVDHVGWSTRLVDGRWEPTFPNARYLYVEREWDYWREAPADEHTPAIEDSVVPLFEAGLTKLVTEDHRVTDEIRLAPTPGHTPGHVSVHISSEGEEAVITGDMIHHPCQIAHPDWSTPADWDQELSRTTRWAFLERYADTPVLIIGTHFCAPTAGRLVRDGDSFRLHY